MCFLDYGLVLFIFLPFLTQETFLSKTFFSCRFSKCHFLISFKIETDLSGLFFTRIWICRWPWSLNLKLFCVNYILGIQSLKNHGISYSMFFISLLLSDKNVYTLCWFFLGFFCFLEIKKHKKLPTSTFLSTL